MYFDTSFNNTATVLSNIHTAFLETALKMYTYSKALSVSKQISTKLLIKTIRDVVKMSYVLIKSKRNEGYKCRVKEVQFEWLAMMAFRKVLRRRQSRYGQVIRWLNERIGRKSEQPGIKI